MTKCCALPASLLGLSIDGEQTPRPQPQTLSEGRPPAARGLLLALAPLRAPALGPFSRTVLAWAPRASRHGPRAALGGQGWAAAPSARWSQQTPAGKTCSQGRLRKERDRALAAAQTRGWLEAHAQGPGPLLAPPGSPDGHSSTAQLGAAQVQGRDGGLGKDGVSLGIFV